MADARSATPESPAVASPTEEPLWLEVVDSETESRTKPLLERVADEHRERPRAQPPAVPSDKGTPVASAKPSAKPEWSDWLLAFMEQRNLNWGELIGGLMILSGSLALVFSFWNEIAGRPLLKFCVFNGFTAGLFAAGRYALSRLQLPSTARALYAIGTLLVPLNLLAMASFSRGDAATSPLLLLGELLSVTLFAWLLFRAGGVLSPEAPARLAWGVLGPALACLLIARLDLPHGARWLPLVLGLWPAAMYVGANLWRLPAGVVLPATGDTPGGLTTTPTGVPHVADPATQAPSPPATAWWRLATTSFATLLPLGLLLARGTSEQARTLAPLFPLLAAPSLGLALACSRKNAPQRSAWTRLLAWLAGFPPLGFMVGGLLLSWPSVWPCLLTIAAMTAVLSWLSARERALGLWLLSLPGVLLGWLLLLGLLRRQIDWHTTDPDLLGEVLLDPWNPLALLPLVGLLLAGSRTARVVGSPLSKGMQLGGALIGLFSLVHTCGTSLGKAGDPGWGSLVLLLYGVGGWLVAELATRRDPSANSPSEGAALSPDRQRPQPAVRPSHAAHQATGPVAFHAAQVALGLLSVWLLVVGSWQLVVVRFPTLLPPHASLVPLLAAGLLLVAPPWRRALPNTAPAPSQPRGLDWLRTLCVAGLTALAVWGGFLAWAWGARQWLPLHGLACAGAWFVLAWRQRRSNSAGSLWFGAAQFLAAISSGLALTQFLTDRAWAGRIQPELFDPVVWQWGGTAAGLQCLLWLGLRAWVTVRPDDPVANSSQRHSFGSDLAALMHAPAGLGDRWLVAGLSGALLLLAGYAVFPGAARELTPRQQANSWTPASATAVALPATAPARGPALAEGLAPAIAAQPSVPPRRVPPLSTYELPGIPHDRATGRGMWAWWGVLVLVSLGWQWWAPSRLHGGLLLSTLAAAAPLCAVSWENDVASASALRWLLTAGIVLTAASAWCLSTRPSPGHFSHSLLDRCVRPFAEEWVTLAMLFKLACLIGFALIVGVLLTTPPAGPFLSTSDLTLGLAVAGCGLVVGLLIQLDVFRPLLTTDGNARAADSDNHPGSPPATGSQLPQAGAGANSLPRAGTPAGLDHSAWAGLVWLVGLGPLVVMTLFGIAQALRGNPLLGPEPGSLFHSLGQALNYAIPLTAWGL
ncbi:MAG: hypothetical protein ACKOFW_07200, partial [Planctomycetaceae bacterium]